MSKVCMSDIQELKELIYYLGKRLEEVESYLDWELLNGEEEE